MKDRENNKEPWKYKWPIEVLFITFGLSLLFSYISTNAIENLNIILSVFVLIFVILIGVITDIIGVAVTVGNEEDFHAKASRKIKGAKSSINLIRNSAKVANICCDVIGDVCGVLSGAISALIAAKIATTLSLNINVDIFISAIVAAVTVGSKALGKIIGQECSTEIIHIVGKLINKFKK